MEIGLSLGSNLGKRLENLQTARTRIASIENTSIIDSSPVYETEPVDVAPEYQDKNFLNAVTIVDSPRDIHEFADRLEEIELELGRGRTGDRNAPRPLDIDIIYAGQIVISSGMIKVPHKLWAGRRFVVQPLADVRPGLVIPGETRTIQQVLSALPTQPAVTLFREDW